MASQCFRSNLTVCSTGRQGWSLTGAPVQALEATANRLPYFLERFPEYRKTLRLALTHEQTRRERRSYVGWQCHDAEAHPTKLIRLATAGLSRSTLRTRTAP